MYRVARILACIIAGIAAGTLTDPAALASCEQDGETRSCAASLAVEVAELRTEVVYLKDRQQIHDVYLRYMRGFDRNDVELLRSAFWPDVQINYGSQSNTIDEFVVRHLNQHTAELETWGHLITNETVDITGNVAHVETYVTALWVPRDDKSFASKSPIVGGRYVDRLERRDGEWRIAVREFIPHFWTKTNLSTSTKETKPPSNCAKGTLDKRDPSYQRPLTRRANKEIGPACTE